MPESVPNRIAKNNFIHKKTKSAVKKGTKEIFSIQQSNRSQSEKPNKQ